ncbi:MAG: transcriptional repressor [Candidatus Omnitrophica bacterium]|nr:transcriptional repressor [Candidatus Omnitrophota bacterium]
MRQRHCNRPGGWQGKLRGCGYRITIGREAILDVLTKYKDKHLSAEDIYLKVHSIYSDIGLTSVYRTLDMLISMGMVSKFDFGDGRARYEIAGEGQKEDHHHHLVCTICKRVINYNDFIDEELQLINKTEKSLSEKHKFEIRSHLVQFYGICDKCKKKK